MYFHCASNERTQKTRQAYHCASFRVWGYKSARFGAGPVLPLSLSANVATFQVALAGCASGYRKALILEEKNACALNGQLSKTCSGWQQCTTRARRMRLGKHQPSKHNENVHKPASALQHKTKCAHWKSWCSERIRSCKTACSLLKCLK